MAIVKMKRLHMLALESDRDELFDKLQHLGCLEVAEQSDRLSDPEWAALVTRNESLLSRQQEQLDRTAEALKLLDRFAPAKSGLLSTRPTAMESHLFDDAAGEKTMATAQELEKKAAEADSLTDRIQKTGTAMKALVPWLSLDVPLETQPTGPLFTAFGTIPASSKLDELKEALQEAADASELYTVSTDTDLHYLFFLCHKAQKEEAMEVLKAASFSNVSFKGLTGTAQENFDALALELSALEQQQEELLGELSTYGESRKDLQLLYDRLTSEIQKEDYKERLLNTEQSFFLGGWVAAEDTGKLEALLQNYDCAYALTDPTEEEYPDVPVKLKNGFLSRCMNTVTEMYSLPAYDGVDPNPLMAPFFIFFFGMMMADMAYGLLMFFGCLLILKKKRPRESQRNFFELFMLCGISTFIFGALTGGFFGDFIPQLLKIINPDSTFVMPALFTPLDDTVAILIGSLILGVIQIMTGMVVSAVKKIRDGNIGDAIWEEFTWWIILIGAALAILGIANAGGIPVILIIGVVMLIYGSGRNAKGFGKVTALVGAVYNGVTGYFSDTLSYLRLMALMLSGSVIAQVFNTLGAVFGNVLLFIAISLIGNALNLALNLLGCYVHDLRLQCLEFFNRFYKDGGRAYAPLSIQTKYFDIIKEEQ